MIPACARTTGALFLAVAALSGLPVAAVEVVWKAGAGGGNRFAVEVSGVPAAVLNTLAQTNWTTAQWHDLFIAVAETGDLVTDIGLPPMLGRYEVSGQTVLFTPAFPLEPGVAYRATFRPAALPGGAGSKEKPLGATYRIPKKVANPTTTVSAIYPSASVLPENILKFYLHFSAPMSRGHIYDHIHLFNAAGEPVELPFLEIDEELWNPEMTRLTLFLDPGRIKRGVRPLEEVGPSLEPGKTYSLVIAPEWLDAAGQPLRSGFSKKFTVAPADRETPDPANWSLEAPRAGSRTALKVSFPEPLDRALTERFFRLTSGDGHAVVGTVTIGPEEKSWNFLPETPWPAGDYHLIIPHTIEDLAGNNIGKAFDVDLLDHPEPRFTNTSAILIFTAK